MRCRRPVLAFLSLALLAAGGCQSPPMPQPRLRSAGLELLLLTEAAFYRDDRLCAEEIAADGTPTAHAARCWPAAVHLSALCAAARVEPGWRRRLNEYIAALDAHRADGAGGYDASAYPPKPDRYYDDNAWIALAMLEAHELTGDAAHLARARAALDFALGGEDGTLGGGVWWHEQRKSSKHACSTAPTIVACLRFYRRTGEQAYLDAAERLTGWINQALLDPSDGLYFDHVRLDGALDRTKFSYNTALMIAADCAWFDQTGDVTHLRRARRAAASAVRFWVIRRPGETRGAIRDDAAFASLLAEALLDLYRRDGDARWRSAAVEAAGFVASRNADPSGWHPSKWDALPVAPLPRVRLIDQSAAVRAMILADVVR